MNFLLVWAIILSYFVKNATLDQQSCNRILMDDLNDGVISHINYPFNYTDQLSCQISIRIPNYLSSVHPFICFKFYRFSMRFSDGCFDDYLELYGIGRFCGKGTLKGLAPTTDPLTNLFSNQFCVGVKANEYFQILFQSMFKSSDNGFFATFTFLDSYSPENKELNETIADEGKLKFAPCDSEKEFVCFNRQCIDKGLVCDGKENCADFSDETLTHANCPGSQTIELCNFENDFCMFDHSGWYRGQSAPPFPLLDNTLKNHEGHFVYTDVANGPASLSYTKYPIIPGKDLIKAEIYCLSFWYYMDRYVGRLVVYIAGKDLLRTPVLVKDDAQGMQWNQVEIEITKNYFPLTEVTFEVDRSLRSNIRDNVGIDDISLQPGKCFNNDVTCMFEIGYCGWRSYISGDLRYSARWERHTGPDPNPNTGPLADRFTKNGYYLLMNSNQLNRGDKARIISKPLSLTSGSGTVCLEFWYLVYGSSMGELNVYSIDSKKREKSLWSDPKQNVRKWVYTFVHVSTDGVFQLMFEGVRGSTVLSDIAIDDISVTPGYCQSKLNNANAPGNRPTMNPHYPMNPAVNRTYCMSDEFFCFSGDQCISRFEVCDRIPQCLDRSDESGCPQTGGPLYYNIQPAMNLGSIVGVSLASVGILVITLSLIFFFLTRRRMLRHHRAFQLSTFAPHLLDNFDATMYLGVPKPPPYQDIVDGFVAPVKPPPYLEHPPPPYQLSTPNADLQSSSV